MVFTMLSWMVVQMFAAEICDPQGMTTAKDLNGCMRWGERSL